MWFWFLWLYHLFGLGGALTAWSLLELGAALAVMGYVLVQCVGAKILVSYWTRR